MACERPIPALIDSRYGKSRVFFHWPDCHGVVARPSGLLDLPVGVRRIEIPCGHCFACHQSRAFDILVRAVAESRMYDFSSFITLTVSDEFLPSVFPGGVLDHRPFQLFAKRLRKQIGKFRYLMCGEYGENSKRPHYHLILFGHRFVDGFVRDHIWYCSRVLYQSWPYGHITCDDVCNERIAYVAGYQLKPFQSVGGVSSYVRWSRRPGLGFTWFERFWSDLVRSQDRLTFVLDGREVNISCRYFFEKLSLFSSADYDMIKASRERHSVDESDIAHIMRHDDILRHSAVLKHKQQSRKVNRL